MGYPSAVSAQLTAARLNRPVLRWAGGKSVLLPTIRAKLPTRWERYFEPMAGGAALFFQQRPERATLADINSDLMNFYGVLRSDFESLKRALRPLKASRELYYAFRSRVPTSPLARAVRFAYLNRLAWNGLYRVNQTERSTCR